VTYQLITHDVATDQLAAHLADRDVFIVIASPDITALIADQISDLPTWTAYLIDDRGTVTETDELNALTLQRTVCVLIGAQTQALFTVPKTVPATQLSGLLAEEIPPDGSRDVITITPPGGLICWPMPFVEAIRRIDPRVAAQIEANSLGNLS
jgi:hypothetical protein